MELGFSSIMSELTIIQITIDRFIPELIIDGEDIIKAGFVVGLYLR